MEQKTSQNRPLKQSRTRATQTCCHLETVTSPPGVRQITKGRVDLLRRYLWASKGGAAYYLPIRERQTR
ncbi:hypothetical protein CEXT_685101 [Caerostris extrusa]|uniref:Uncharacterized protein n=1 Tax=Caerostris extrusa TaxID=172846 RepID=A0AAV4V217_CAEEX|nr:hypothetical protein CEXT_685101 [Caerostris extrusa]